MKVVRNIQQLKELHSLPSSVVADDIGVGSGGGSGNTGDGLKDNVKLMTENDVVWHKTCRNSVDQQKVLRARKRHENEDEAASSIKTRRSDSISTAYDKKTCLFCGDVGEKKRAS